MTKHGGILSIAFCALLWSTGGFFIKFINASSIVIAGYRSLVALLGFMVFLRRPPRFLVRDWRGAVSPRKSLLLLLTGFSYCFTMLTFCAGCKLTTSANAILLQYASPLYVIFLGPLMLGEKNSKVDYISGAGVLAGIVIFFAGDISGGNNLGNFLALLSGIGYAFTTVFMRKLPEGYSFDGFMISHLLVAVSGIPFYISGTPCDLSSLVALLLFGLEMACATLLYSRGISHVSALNAIIVTLIEPVMNPVWVMLFAGEKPSLTCIAGGILILGCIVGKSFVTIDRNKK